MLPEQQQRILGYFIEEAKDHLNTIEQGLLNLQSTLNDSEMINEVFRAAHSIKGGAAMLGLSSIQHTAHRLEDCFKVLKDRPIQVDQKLESLFLGVSDTLKALLENLQGPFGLTDEVATTLMSETEPVIKWLNEHLEMLIEQQGGGGIVVSTFAGEGPSQKIAVLPTPPAASLPPNWGELQAQVLQILREMLQLFKQTATLESRQNLQKCCQRLVEAGKSKNLTNWCNLCQATGNAIANPENSYLTLAKIVITEIKQALELVTSGREPEIAINEQLGRLLSQPEIELLEISTDLVDEATDSIEEFEAEAEIIPLELSDEAKDLEPEDKITSLSEEFISAKEFEPEDKIAILELSLFTNKFEPEDKIAISELSLFTNKFELEDKNTTLPELSPDFNINVREDDGIDILDTNGPEVGIAELNTLADLFEFEDQSPELHDSWQQEEILDSTVGESETEIDDVENKDTDSDLDDFLSLDDFVEDPSKTTNIGTNDLTILQLFGDDFLDDDNNESQNQLIVDSLESSQISVVTSNLDSKTDDLLEKITEVKSDHLAENDDVNDLLEAAVDENQTFTKVTQPQIQITANESSFDDLFGETDDVEELDDFEFDDENLSLDSLLALPAEDTQLSVTELETDDLFGNLSENTREFSPQQETSELEDEFSSGFGQNENSEVGLALEESLFAAVASGENFADNQPTILSSQDNFELELDIYLPQEEQLDLLFFEDTEDDLFEEFTANTVGNTQIYSPEINPFEQQPEALELTPEFTNTLEKSEPAFTQSSANGSIDSLPLKELESEEIKVVFEDVPLGESSEDIHEDTDNPFAVQQEDLDDDLFGQETVLNNFDIADLQAESELEETDTDLIELVDFGFDLADDLLEVETQKIVENISKLTDTNQQSHETEIDIFLFDELENFTEDAEAANLSGLLADMVIDETSEVENIENENGVLSFINTSADETEYAALLNEFAQLEALLEEPPSTTSISELEGDFADLEALLNSDKNYDVTSFTPDLVNHGVEIEDEFSDLEKLLIDADQSISSSSSVNTGKTQRVPSRRTAARFEQTMRVPVKHLDDMSNLVGELVVNRNTLEQDQERQRQSLDNLLIQIQQLSDVGARMQELYERSLLEASLLASRKNRDAVIVSHPDTDRGFSELEMDRFTPFHTLSQEMIELIVRVRESASDIDFVTEETERVARQFRQVTTQLQEGLTRARMVPFAQATDRLQRGVRDNAIKSGKQIELAIEGRETLIDKMILEHLTDPLTHMLNNAIVHGIETPDERQATGKPTVGTISVRAFHQGNQTIISVGDDGAGINSDKIKAKAIKIGMITQEEAKNMSRKDVYDLLFQPGFSIKDEADELAGRGVGMDVVRSSITEIRGAINTDSKIGKGTTFTIRLPLTLSICKALCCVSDKARIAFPMDGVEDTLDIPLKNIQHGSDGQQFIFWRDTMLPFKPLKDLLTFNRQMSRGNVYGGTRDDDMVSVIVVRSATTFIALQIDLVLNEQEIVIKQFEGPAPKPIGVAGATVLGDGRIMPIADVLEIIDIFQGRTSKQSSVSLWDQQKGSGKDTGGIPKIDPTVLIVDDSITVRELLSLTFNKAGYRVEQARDGQEAWDKLRSGLPCDIVFCDIEMPRCDGLELLSRIQKESSLNHLPIAMLTSRGADKHRQMAVQLGASGYFTKPYLEEALLEAAGRMLKGEKLLNSNV